VSVLSSLGAHRLRLALRSTALRSLWRWNRERGLRPEDVFIACYPRSGSNWLQFMLVEYLTGRSADFAALRRASPYVGHHRGAVAIVPGRRRLIKTHEQYHPVYRQAILMARDPRDVVRSDYRFVLMQGEYAGSFDDFVGDFVGGRAHGFGSWADHGRSWIRSGLQEQGRLVTIRYEDLHQDTLGELRRALRFLGADVDPAAMDRAVEENTLERMRQKEASNHDILRRKRDDLRYVNQGAVGGWDGFLSRVQEARILDAFGDVMAHFGYYARLT
jgi:hypothetical protein